MIVFIALKIISPLSSKADSTGQAFIMLKIMHNLQLDKGSLLAYFMCRRDFLAIQSELYGDTVFSAMKAKILLEKDKALFILITKN